MSPLLSKSPNNIQLFWYDVEQNFLSYANWGTGAITSPSNAYYMKFHVEPAYGTTYNNDISINYPSTDTAYHSGKDNTTYQIQLGQTVYGGTIDAVHGVLTVTHGVKVLDGSETWLWSGNNDLGLTMVQNGIITDVVTQHNLYTQNSTFSDKSWATRSTVDGSIGMFFGRSALYAKYSKFTTAEEVNAFFAENPTTVVYELATPIEIQLTAQEIRTLLDENNIWCDSGDISVGYWKWGK